MITNYDPARLTEQAGEEAQPEWISALPKVTESRIRDEFTGHRRVDHPGRLLHPVSLVKSVTFDNAQLAASAAPPYRHFHAKFSLFDGNLADRSGCATDAERPTRSRRRTAIRRSSTSS